MNVPELEPGTVLSGTYRVVRRIAIGGMGVVYEASHLRLRARRVAIKVLLAERASDSEAFARFKREAEIGAQLDHPNIVKVTDWDRLPDGTPFIVMDFLEGESLSTRLQRGSLPYVDALQILREVGAALAAAHHNHVVHRDLKPDNIFLTTDCESGVAQTRVKVLDFGISKIYRSRTLANNDDKLLGTPEYMAPEQLRGDDSAVGPATDQFALATIAYEMFSGRLAFVAADVATILFKVVYDAPPPLAEAAPRLPRPLVDAIERAMAKKPNDRFPDIATFIEALTAAPLGADPGLCSPPAMAGQRGAGPMLVAIDTEHAPNSLTADWSISEQRSAVILTPPRLKKTAESAKRKWLRVAAITVLCALVGTGTHLWWQLPIGQRALLIEVSADPRDSWLAAATIAMTKRKLRDQRRFAVVDHTEDANVLLRMTLARHGKGVRLVAELGRRRGHHTHLGMFVAPSVAAALDQLLPQVVARVGQGRSEEGVNAAELAAMRQLGTTSYPAYRLYQQALQRYFGSLVVDSPAVARLLVAALRMDSKWAHAYALLWLVQGQTSATAQTTLEQALAASEENQDPTGYALLRSFAAARQSGAAEAVRLIEQKIPGSINDVLVLHWLATQYGFQRLADEIVSTYQHLHSMAPELQFGIDLAAALQRAGRSQEVPAMLKDWFSNTPENEQALTALIGIDLEQRQLDTALQRARDLLLLHGETPFRLITLCDTLIAVGNVNEAREIAFRLVAGGPRERAFGRYRLGVLAVIEGRLTAARDTFEMAVQEQRPLGTESELIQTLEALVNLDERLGAVDERNRHLDDLAHTLELFGVPEDAVSVRFERQLLTTVGKACSSIEPELTRITRASALAIARRDMLRAAAMVGCAPCESVVSAGLSLEERTARSTYRLGLCAQKQAAWQLAADVFARTMQYIGSSFSPNNGFSPDIAVLSHFRYAQVMEKMGRLDVAKTEYQRFLEYWQHADPPLREVGEALAALKRLP